MNFFYCLQKKNKTKTINWTIILLILLIFIYLYFQFINSNIRKIEKKKKNKRYGLIKDYREFKINVKIVLLIIKQIYIKETNY